MTKEDADTRRLPYRHVVVSWCSQYSYTQCAVKNLIYIARLLLVQDGIDTEAACST
jgi:hypothetical protein